MVWCGVVVVWCGGVEFAVERGAGLAETLEEAVGLVSRPVAAPLAGTRVAAAGRDAAGAGAVALRALGLEALVASLANAVCEP